MRPMFGTAVRPVARNRRLVSAAAFAVVASLTLAACGGDDEPEADKSPDAQSTAAGSTLSGRWPLTGLPADGEAPKRPAIVVKIDNSYSSNPQIGLSKADLVVEELVEGGSTRLAVFFYSQLPKVAGPVRSMRATDIGIIQPAKAVLVASGGAPRTVARIRNAGIKSVTEGGTGYYRDNARRAPYNLMMNLTELAATLKSREVPDSYLPWGSEEDFPGGQPARKLAATFSGGHTTNWQFQGGKYVNLNSETAQGDEYTPDTVLVLKVRVGDAGYKDPAGNPVPETVFSGKGQALVFHGGKVVRGTWSKSGLDSALQLQTRAGDLKVPAGKVWIELVPANGGDVTFGK